MSRVPFEELPEHGRLWVFPTGRALTDTERQRCLSVVDTFLDQWAAHGQPLRSGRVLHAGRFVVVGVDVDAERPSGCSIDALTNALRGLGSEMGTSFIDHAPVWYRDGDDIHAVSRPTFRALAEAGTVSPTTRVFDTSLTRIGDFRAGRLERPATETWHGRAFFGGGARVDAAGVDAAGV